MNLNFKPIFRFHILLLVGIIFTAAFLRIKDIQAIPFFGDIGWFYLSARDMLLTGHIPLVGITASHTWLHQGPWWTYFLAIFLAFFHYDPLSGVYLSIFIGLMTVIAVYIVGKTLFNATLGISAAFLYATSPLAIILSRTPYHTTPIPFFTLLYFFAMHKWVNGARNYFPLIILSLTMLYNFELATVSLWLIFLGILFFGYWKKSIWFQKTFSKRNVVLTFFAFVIPMLPIIFYDINHGYPQTIKYVVWLGYHGLALIGIPIKHGEVNQATILQTTAFFLNNYQKLIFLPNYLTSMILFLGSFLFLMFKLHHLKKTHIYYSGTLLLSLWVIIPTSIFIANKTPSDAYLPLFFPGLILMLSFLLTSLMVSKKRKIVLVIFIFFIVILNVYSLLSSSYLTSNDGKRDISYQDQLLISKKIILEAQGKQYNIKGRGDGSQFRSYTMPYEYLTWWLGHPDSNKKETLDFFVSVKSGNIVLSTK